MSQSKYRKEFRRFRSLEEYSDLSEEKEYFLLPHNFERLSSGREVLINMVGDFQIVPEGTVQAMVDGNFDLLERDMIKDLVAGHFLSESEHPKSIEVLANRYRTIKSHVQGFTRLHIFVISLRCEHTCQYCQVSRVSQNKEKFDLSRSRLIKAIELMLQCPDEHLTMEFQGGEALLAFENIRFAIEYTDQRASSLGKTIQYVICTNLAPMTDEIADFCRENNVLVSASLDGPDYLHNYNRKRPGRNSHELVEKGVNLVRERIGNDSVSVLMTTSTESLKYPIEIIDEYRRLGFDSIFLRPISPYGFAVYNKRSHYMTEDFLEFYKTGLDYIIELNKKGEQFYEAYTGIVLKKMFTAFTNGYVDLMSPSGAVNNVIVYDFDGNVYVSDEARMLAQMKDHTFKIGTVNNTWDQLVSSQAIELIKETGINDYLAGCDSCSFNVYCGADPVHHHSTQGDAYGFRPTSSFCKRNLGVFRYILELIDSDPAIEDIFRTWISNG